MLALFLWGILAATVVAAATPEAGVQSSLDKTILIWLNSDMGSTRLDVLFQLVSSEKRFLFPLVFVLLAWLVYAYRLDGVKVWLLMVMVIFIGDFVGGQLKDYFNSYRPCFDMYQQLRSIPGDSWPCGAKASGMPSNHALNVFSVSIFLILVTRGRPEMTALLTIAFLVSVSRVYLAKHYPSQVLVGAFVGMNIGAIAAIVFAHYFASIRHLTYKASFLSSLSGGQDNADSTG
jgi:undecaprenyl-diphosphatase